MNIFIKKTDIVNIPVWTWLDTDDNIEATDVESEVPNGKEAKVLNLKMRRVSYLDSTTILRQAIAAGKNETPDATVFQEMLFRNQLSGWDIVDDNGAPVPVNATTINELSPAIARAATNGYLSKVKI